MKKVRKSSKKEKEELLKRLQERLKNNQMAQERTNMNNPEEDEYLKTESVMAIFTVIVTIGILILAI